MVCLADKNINTLSLKRSHLRTEYWIIARLSVHSNLFCETSGKVYWVFQIHSVPEHRTQSATFKHNRPKLTDCICKTTTNMTAVAVCNCSHGYTLRVSVSVVSKNNSLAKALQTSNSRQTIS